MGDLSIFIFPTAHASGGMRETEKTQKECNNSEIYEISEVVCKKACKASARSCS